MFMLDKPNETIDSNYKPNEIEVGHPHQTMNQINFPIPLRKKQTQLSIFPTPFHTRLSLDLHK